MVAPLIPKFEQDTVLWDAIPAQIPGRSGKKATDLPLDPPRIIKNLAEAIQSADYTELLEISSNTLSVVSFWGKGKIRAINYEGEAPIDSLAKKVIELVRVNHFEYTQEERTTGKKVANEITRIYHDLDKEVLRSCYLTRLFCAIRKFFYRFESNISQPTRRVSLIRDCWEHSPTYNDDNNCTSFGTVYDSGFNEVFKYYTKKQFIERYGKEPVYTLNLFGHGSSPKVELAHEE